VTSTISDIAHVLVEPSLASINGSSIHATILQHIALPSDRETWSCYLIADQRHYLLYYDMHVLCDINLLVQYFVNIVTF
jgi:hypothetical protein